MNFKKEYNSLVIAGSWNNAIINPDWLTKYIIQDTKLNVEFPLNINASLRMSTEELRIFTLDGKLNLAVLKNEDDVFNKIGELGIKIADNLMHTPVTAFGINFVFECEGGDDVEKLFALTDSEDISNAGFAITSSQIRRELVVENKHLNLNIIKSDNKYSFDFNYNTAIKSLVEFKDMFDEGDIVKFKNESISLLKNLYDLEME